ncbi:hypothetical protein C6Y14_05085 [Streptomyces dioscori]|uniref:Uncharacterized protein n=1 Tax=Streptomyces dioscori TaxID=2109333 RepID=A0A2P8QDV5_9ACTN|nr:hypothetical protein [Streptomyces dioscori]PSM44414.1 hypothetical protein C6Y14_05085 [Streptomyces dioscori]
MAIRPSTSWRARVDGEARELASGARDPSDAFMSQLFPESLLSATDEALGAFESDVRGLIEDRGRDKESGDEESKDNGRDGERVFGAIERVVLVLNGINDGHGGAGYETQEREELCLYIDQTLTEHGIDVPALAAGRGIGRAEITDDWRDW